MLKLFNNLKLSLIKTDFYKGAHRVWVIPKMPVSIYKIHNHIFVRILRFCGGIAFLIMVTNIYSDFPFLIKFFINILAFLLMVWIVFISLVKFFFGVYVLMYHRDWLEVRNSPLNKAASIISNVLYWGLIGGCLVTAGVGTASGLGIALDSLLEGSGYDPVFKPLAKKTIDYVHKNTGLFSPANQGNNNLPSTRLRGEPGKLIKGLTEEMSTEDKKNLSAFVEVYSKASAEEKAIFWETVSKNITKN